MSESTTNKLKHEAAIQQAHAEAVDTQAVERYISDEMTEDQRVQFEEHYFECPACARAVQAGQEFIAGITPAAPAPVMERLRQWAPTAMAAALLGVVGYQNVAVIPALHAQVAPQENTDIVARETEMGSGPEPTSVAAHSATIRIDLQEIAFPFYRATVIRDNDKHDLFSLVVPAPTRGAISLHTTKEALGAGAFKVAVIGLASRDASDGKPLPEYHFKLN